MGRKLAVTHFLVKSIPEPYTPGSVDVSGMSIATFSDPDDDYFPLVSPMAPEVSG